MLNLSVLGNVVYEYHYHDTNSSCYNIIRYEQKEDVDWYDGSCGNDWCSQDCRHYHGKGTYSDVPVYNYTCGYNNGQIISATITY